MVVLGFANRGRRANAVNRWRARAALRACRPDLGPSRLVLCGSAARGPVPEADLLADRVRAAAEARGIVVVLERESRSTWENVANAGALVEDVDRIKVVSQPLHAEKARLYLWRQRPDLAERLVPVEGTVDGWTVLAPLLVLHGRWRLRAARRALR